MVIFRERDHRYLPGAEWNQDMTYFSVSSFVSSFHEHFDAAGAAAKVSAKPTSKWYGLSPDEIQRIWKQEADRSTRIGHQVHAKRERDLLAKKRVNWFGRDLPVYECMYNTAGEKFSFNQRLYDGVHPEMLLYTDLTDRIGLAGQSDVPVFFFTKPDETEAEVNISDYKTNKELVMDNPWRNMYYPFDRFPDTNYWHYVVQLNAYARIVQRNNPGTRIGKLVINHIGFVVDSVDRFGFPIIRMESGEPVINSVSKIELPVLDPDMMDTAFEIFAMTRYVQADLFCVED